MDENNSSGTDRRQSFRINDEVYLDYRPLQPDEDDFYNDSDIAGVCRGLMELRDLNQQSSHLLVTIRKHHSDVAHYLSLIDRKIETLAQMTAAIGMGRDITPSHRVNLGTGGMAFTSDKPLDNGQRLAVKLVLFPSHLCLQLTARVVYSNPKEGQEGYCTGVQFNPLPEHDNDALIRHLLEKQSAQLREERDKEDRR